MLKTTLISSIFVLIGIFSGAIIALPTQSVHATALKSNFLTPIVIGDPMGDKGIWAVDASLNTIIGDGDLADWDGLAFGIFNGINISLAYDTTSVYIALQWKDTTNDISVGQWNKSGMINPSLVNWTFVDGADDAIQIGFTQGVSTDIMIWTTSARTNDDLAFECNATGIGDGGTLPYIMNTNETSTFVDAKPILQNDFLTPIANEVTDANGTMYHAWYNTTTTATHGQANTAVSADWNTTLKDHYTVEMIRLLDTTDSDDFILDFSEALSFEVGVANKDSTFDMHIPTTSLKVSTTNEAADLTFTEIATNPVFEAFVITGCVFDDFIGYNLTISMDGWVDTYGTIGMPTSYPITVNEVTGNYSFLFFFDEWDMPLGEQTIFVTLYPKYDAPIQLNQTIEIDDIKSPNIEGIVNLQDRYPNGVPLDEDYVVITVGLTDDYCVVDDIVAYLYHYVGDDVALKTDMVQFAPGSSTFVANISIEHAFGEVNKYTYFVQAWDANLNKVTSNYYEFSTAADDTSSPPNTNTQSSYIIPLPTLEITLTTMVLITIIGKASQKKRKLTNLIK